MIHLLSLPGLDALLPFARRSRMSLCASSEYRHGPALHQRLPQEAGDYSCAFALKVDRIGPGGRRQPHDVGLLKCPDDKWLAVVDLYRDGHGLAAKVGLEADTLLSSYNFTAIDLFAVAFEFQLNPWRISADGTARSQLRNLFMHIDVTVRPDGSVKTDVEGATGANCVTTLDDLHNRVGARVVDEQLKPAYYEEAVVEQTEPS